VGELLGSWLVTNGFAGFVSDGLVRDSTQLRSLDLGVWCRGVTPVASTRIGPGGPDVPVSCGAVTVSPGDVVIADDDGVVVWPAARVEQLLGEARARLRWDRTRIERIRAGQPPD
jgi:regulator of RNase E activity RraA